MKLQRATERNARKNNPPSETKTMIMTLEFPPEGGGGLGMTCGGGGGGEMGLGWNGGGME